MSKHLNGLIALGTTISIVGAVLPTVAFADTMTPTQAADKIASAQTSFHATNDTKESDILEYANAVTTGSGVTVSLGGSFQLSPASSEVTGTVSVNLSLTNGTDPNKNMTFTSTIPKLESEEDARKAMVKANFTMLSYLRGSTYTNLTTATDIEKMLISQINNADIKVTISKFNLVPATNDADGNCDFFVLLTSSKTDATADSDFGRLITKLSESTSSAGSFIPRASSKEDMYMQTILDDSSDYLDNYKFTNDTTEAEVLAMLKSHVTDPTITVTMESFNLVKATAQTKGSVNLYVLYVNKNGDDCGNHYGTDFSAQTGSTTTDTAGLTEAMINLINISTPEGSTGRWIYTDDLGNTTVVYSNGKSFTAKSDTTIINPNDQHMLFIKYIEIQTRIGTSHASNSFTQDLAQSRVDALLFQSDITGVVSNFSLTKATYSSAGSCSFTVTLKDPAGDTRIYEFSKTIDKLTSSPSSNSSNSSSSSSSSSSNSSNSLSTATTTGSTESQNKADTLKSIMTSGGKSAVTKDTIAKAISTIGLNNTLDPTVAKEIAKEVAKVVTENIVNNLSPVVGQGVTANETKEVTASDGNKISVTAISKDGTSLGAVITAEKDSATTTIPVDTASGKVTTVYKYIPLLGKYIQVTDGVVIGTNTITLPTQANATYVAVSSQMASTDTVGQGWAKVDNSWYLLSATGTPQTGWQKDNVGWSYLSPETAVMQTGWKQQGDNWYLLKSNGYMATGWTQNNGSWYYLNADGSMASNTKIDGYTLGPNGAWIR